MAIDHSCELFLSYLGKCIASEGSVLLLQTQGLGHETSPDLEESGPPVSLFSTNEKEWTVTKSLEDILNHPMMASIHEITKQT